MICTTALILMNLAGANMTDVHRQTTCVQEPVKLVNFIAVQDAKRKQVKRNKIIFDKRRAKIKGLG